MGKNTIYCSIRGLHHTEIRQIYALCVCVCERERERERERESVCIFIAKALFS